MKRPSHLFVILNILALMFCDIHQIKGAITNQSQKSTKDWTIVASYTIPGKASGLAWDGTFIYYGIYGSNGDHVYKFDPISTTSEVLFTNSTIGDSFGMTYDGSTLWITDHGLSSSVPAYALQLDFSGSILSQFDLPDHYMSGIAFDNGDFWVCTYYPNPGTIYKVDATGNVLSQFIAPDEQPWDICVENDNLWIAEYDNNMLYKVDQSGMILENHDCENIKPAGVVFDGQYLWYVDGQLSSNSTLYKVDLQGGGTPQIEVPQTNYNYGNVTVGDSAIWNCTIENTGSANLEITGIIIQNAVPIFIYEPLPNIIEPGATTVINFTFKPTETGSLYTVVTLQSNDPVNPEVELTLEGEAVFDGPHIQVPVPSYNYSSTRVNATTRWFLEVYNDGNSTLEINEIMIDDDNFYLDESVSFPINLGVLQTKLIGIWFNPTETGNYSGIATILHNDVSQGSIEVLLSGSGDDSPYPIGDAFWNYTINTSYDNSIKAMAPIEDVSGDGKGDIIVCSEDDYVRCFNGNSSGIGDILWETEAGSVYHQNGLIIIEDIDGDGFEDVIVGLAWGERAIKAFSGKTGEQLWIYDTHVYGDGGWVYQVWTGYDYNGDGIDDVLASTGNDGNNTGPKRIFCIDGVNGSIIWDANTDGPNFACLGVSDFTGDGIPDAIAGSSTNDESDGKVYGIDGANGTIDWTFTAGGSSVWALEQLDDATGDGIKDIIAGDFSGNYYLINASNGSSFYSGSAGSSIFIRFERLEDVNNNGYADIAFAYSGTNAIVIDGYSGENIWLTGLADKCWNIDKIADISGDGINDLVAGTLFSNNYCYFIDGVSGDIIESISYGEAVDAITAIPDINGDNTWEMVAGGRNGKVSCISGGEITNTLMANFTADITQGYAPLTVQFTDQSLGNINTWEWDFENDGVIDSWEQNPEFIYLYSGEKSVTLIISNSNFSDTLTKENYISADTLVNISEKVINKILTATPNPFSDDITIQIKLHDPTPIILHIYNVYGQLVQKLKFSKQSTGFQSIIWDGYDRWGKKVENGIYIVRVNINGIEHKLKIIYTD